MKTRAAIILLCTFLVRHQLWESELIPNEAKAQVWNIGGAFAFLVLLAYTGQQLKSLLAWAIIELWAYEEQLVLVCGGWRLIEPWIVGPGQGQCQAKLGFRLSIMTTVVVGIIAINILDRLKTEGRETSQ